MERASSRNQLSPLPKIGEGFGEWSEAPSYEEGVGVDGNQQGAPCILLVAMLYKSEQSSSDSRPSLGALNLRAEESKRNGVWGYPPTGGTLHHSRPSLGALNLRAEALDLWSLATNGTQESKK